LVWLLAVGPALAGAPLDFIQQSVDKLFDVLNDPRYQGEQGKLEQQEVLFDMSKDIFDYIELSRRTLGRNWNELTTEQRMEFTDLYSRLLKNAYIDKIQSYTDQAVEIKREIMLGGDKAVVETYVVDAGKRVPIDYSLVLNKEGWRVYDVKVEGVSLVKNYRTQFNEILSGSPPEEMLRILREKVQTSQG